MSLIRNASRTGERCHRDQELQWRPMKLIDIDFFLNIQSVFFFNSLNINSRMLTHSNCNANAFANITNYRVRHCKRSATSKRHHLSARPFTGPCNNGPTQLLCKSKSTQCVVASRVPDTTRHTRISRSQRCMQHAHAAACLSSLCDKFVDPNIGHSNARARKKPAYVLCLFFSISSSLHISTIFSAHYYAHRLSLLVPLNSAALMRFEPYIFFGYSNVVLCTSTHVKRICLVYIHSRICSRQMTVRLSIRYSILVGDNFVRVRFKSPTYTKPYMNIVIHI